jgi:hypothetical protein
MDEKILIEAKFKKNYVSLILLGLAIFFILLALIVASSVYSNGEGYEYFGFGYGGVYPYDIIYDSFGEFFAEEFFEQAFGYFMIAVAPAFALAALFLFLLFRCELVVTDKRVYGKAAFGTRIDLPINKISSIGLGVKLFSSVAVATSSGKIKFYLLKNREEVYQTISNAIANIETPITEIDNKQNSSFAGSAADELKKYKELLDSGIITQEEFDAKKKQLLGF